MFISGRPVRAYLGLGSNLGQRANNLNRALDAILLHCGKVVACSDFLETQPEGMDTERLFVNAVCEIVTPLTPMQLLRMTQYIEKAMGRHEKSHDGKHFDRTIDIDILWMEGVQIDTPELTIPHKHLCERRFVLKPLCQIAPDFRPIPDGPTVSEMLAAIEESAQKSEASAERNI